MNYFVVIVIILMAGRVSIKRVYTRLTGGNTGYDNRVKLRYNKLKPLNYRDVSHDALKCCRKCGHFKVSTNDSYENLLMYHLVRVPSQV